MRPGRFPQSRAASQGVVFLAALLLLPAIVTLTAVGLTRSTHELAVAERFVDTQQALHLAEGALGRLARTISVRVGVSVRFPLRLQRQLRYCLRHPVSSCRNPQRADSPPSLGSQG